MALIIKGDMPKGCGLCWECLGGSDAYYCNRTKRQISEVIPPYDKRMEWCPILCEIPDKHGDLIDRDLWLSTHWVSQVVIDAINDAPVVVEATE